MLHFMALSQPISNMRWRFSFNPVSHPGPCVCSQHLAVSSGSGQADLEKLCQIMEAVPSLKYICLDVANGYSEYFVEFVKTVRGKFPKHTIMVRFICLSVCLSVCISFFMLCVPDYPSASLPVFRLSVYNAVVLCFWQAGNVVTGEMVEELILSGADIIKVGIGPGLCVCVAY